MQAKTTVKVPAPKAAKGLLYSAVALSLVAALIHLWVTPEHFGEWWGYGTFMLAAFVAQAIYSAALLVWPRWRLLLLAGVIGNLAIIGMWVVSRTISIPLGPAAGEVEGIGALDLICTASEVMLVVVLLGLLNLYRRRRVAHVAHTLGARGCVELRQGELRRPYLLRGWVNKPAERTCP